MNQPEDEVFRDILSGYVREPDDAGFSLRVVEAVKTRSRQEQRIRRTLLLGAFVFGGLLAGRQLKALTAYMDGLLGRFAVPGLDIPHAFERASNGTAPSSLDTSLASSLASFVTDAGLSTPMMVLGVGFTIIVCAAIILFEHMDGTA